MHHLELGGGRTFVSDNWLLLIDTRWSSGKVALVTLSREDSLHMQVSECVHFEHSTNEIIQYDGVIT